jgi:transcriptional regulator with XRE-family HTH domain
MGQEPSSSVGAAIRSWRERRGLSQESLAEATRPDSDGGRIDQSYISRLERDLHSPSVDTLCRLARALQVDPHLLLVCPEPAAEAV